MSQDDSDMEFEAPAERHVTPPPMASPASGTAPEQACARSVSPPFVPRRGLPDFSRVTTVRGRYHLPMAQPATEHLYPSIRHLQLDDAPVTSRGCPISHAPAYYKLICNSPSDLQSTLTL